LTSWYLIDKKPCVLCKKKKREFGKMMVERGIFKNKMLTLMAGSIDFVMAFP